VDAGRSGQVFLISDMATERRWPDYNRHAAERGVGSSLSVPLPFQVATIGALNNYSTRPGAFGEEDIAVGEEIASWVAFAVANASAAATAVDEAAHMREAMITRGGIEQAKGILMERHKVTPDQAFTILSQASQRTGIKLRDVASELVTTGALPGSL
jgi:GAF domain-containing protein